MANSIIILAIVVLPGWISISVNQRYHPRIFATSTTMTWGIMFYHALVVHIIGGVSVALVALIWQGYFLDTLGLDRILAEGPASFTKNSPRVAFAVFGLYGLWMVIGSAISGIVDLPSKVTEVVGKAMNKLKLAPEPLREEPVWYRALSIDRRGEDGHGQELKVQVSIRMKNGDVYEGSLHSYQIYPASDQSKDIRLGNSVLYPGGDTSAPVELDFGRYGGGGVLLNTTNISSIEYILHDDYELRDDNNDG